MTTKIELTPQQAKAIESFLKNSTGGKAKLLDSHSSGTGWFSPTYIPLNSLSPSDLARAVLIGYTVKPHISVGQWARTKEGDYRGIVTDIVNENQVYAKWNYSSTADWLSMNNLVPMPEEEIPFAEINRKYLEFKEGDVIEKIHGNAYKLFKYRVGNCITIERAVELYKENEIKNIYPVASAHSLKKGGGMEDGI